MHIHTTFCKFHGGVCAVLGRFCPHLLQFKLKGTHTTTATKLTVYRCGSLLKKGFGKGFCIYSFSIISISIFCQIINSLKTLHFNRKICLSWKIGLWFTTLGKFIWSFWGKDLIVWKFNILMKNSTILK